LICFLSYLVRNNICFLTSNLGYHILNNFSRSILLHAYEEGDESRFMSETTGIKIVPIVEHNKKGINKFFENSFAGATKQDLKIFLEEVLNYEG